MSKRPIPSTRGRRPAASPAAAGFRPAVGVLAVAAAFSLHAPALLAQPAGAQAIHGAASLARNGNNLVVTTTNGAGTGHSAINWQSFSVPAGSVTQFKQPTASSLSVNRVVGSDPSAIFGTLSSNGRLVLVNPAGITVGAGAVVDTAGFTASTLRMSDADALAGRLVFGDGGSGALQVDGRIVAKNGDVVLIAPNVQTGANAVVQSEGGSTILAAGQKVEITGRGLEGIRLEVQAGSEARNLGTLKGDAVGIFADTLKHSGLIQANAAATEGGRVVLKAAAGDALVDGAVSATSATGKGGSIDVLGNRVGLLAGASLDASGAAGGGTVRVGGDYQGKNAEVPNAQRTYVDPQASIQADATAQGDGGKVIVWADNTTQGHGTISARGGPQGGDGGFVEVSGKNGLQFGAKVDTSAPKGKLGTLLLDPDTITVDNLGPGTYSGPILFDGSTGALVIDADALTGQPGNVELRASLDITVNEPVVFTNTGQSFLAEAGRNVTVTTNGAITTLGGAITLHAGHSGSPALPPEGKVLVAGPLTSNNGNITIQSDKSTSSFPYTSVEVSANVAAGGGNVLIQGMADIDVTGASVTGGMVTLSSTGSAGTIYLDNATVSSSAGPVMIQTVGYDVVISNSSAVNSTGGGITVQGEYVDVLGSSLNSGSNTLSLQSVSAASASGAMLSGANVSMTASDGTVMLDGNTTVTATGSGVVTLNGDARTTFGSPGVHLGDVSITAGSITINGHSDYGWGVSMDGNVALTSTSGATITGLAHSAGSGGGGILLDCSCGGTLTGSGNLFMTGTAASGSAHKGVFLNTAGINRTGGNLTISGNGSGNMGLYILGSLVQNAGTINLMGNSNSSIGVNIEGSTITATTSGVIINGTSSASHGFRMGPAPPPPPPPAPAPPPTFTINSDTLINITGTTGAGSGVAAVTATNETFNAVTSLSIDAVNGDLSLTSTALNVSGGSGEVKLRAMAPAPAPTAPAIRLLGGTAVNALSSSAGTAVRLDADTVDIAGGAITTATGTRTMIVPVSPSRVISLGGSDEAGRLTLTQGELNKIATGTLVVGSNAGTGGLHIEGGAPLTLTASALSLIQGSSTGILQTTGSTLTVGALNADAGHVVMPEANSVSTVSGKATDNFGSGFTFYNAGGFSVGTVDLQSGILAGSAPVVLTSVSGGISQTMPITGTSLNVLTSSMPIALDNAGNSFSLVNAQTGAGGSIAIGNSAAASAFNANSGGIITYKGTGSVTLESVGTSSTAAGSTFGTAAISIEAAGITKAPPPPPPPAPASPQLLASGGGSVYLNGVSGDIGASGQAIGIFAPGGITVAGGNNVFLSPGNPNTIVHGLTTTGNVTISGSTTPGATLDLRSATVGGALTWTDYDSAIIGQGGGVVGATGLITAPSDVVVKGYLAPGGVGPVSTMNIGGNLSVDAGGTLKFDFGPRPSSAPAGPAHDVINVTGSTTFAPGDGSTYVFLGGSQPADSSYTLMTGPTPTGGVPTLHPSSTVQGATFAFGSLIAQVVAPTSAPPAPPPPPASASPTSPPASAAPTSPPASSPPAPPPPTSPPASASPTSPPASAPPAPPPPTSPPASSAPPPSTSAPAQQQVDNQVVTFAKLFVEEAKTQDEKDDKKTVGKDDIVLTDSQCKPGS
ncbi:filamentous hemagglutinin N-terminal domain-containing protein [Caenimonas sedimenti]|uniref:Filamentous hemagglutinin N-terminal domain-containing protein n=1 Tax=Caenimonas sedimenti TaxID=2596921 RepID=A0A562ZNG0_9BURK|nr:filamentous hemagglutinin N-terminal domain-containing protein [Caenimonas sedimenti]TWO69684.1 filamentous hemagglutinin N-terminal domain-containing protein [Caenimonas sedimenti]